MIAAAGFLFVLGLVLWLPARRHRRQPDELRIVIVQEAPEPVVTDEALHAWLADE